MSTKNFIELQRIQSEVIAQRNKAVHQLNQCIDQAAWKRSFLDCWLKRKLIASDKNVISAEQHLNLIDAKVTNLECYLLAVKDRCDWRSAKSYQAKIKDLEHKLSKSTEGKNRLFLKVEERVAERTFHLKSELHQVKSRNALLEEWLKTAGGDFALTGEFDNDMMLVADDAVDVNKIPLPVVAPVSEGARAAL